MTPRGWAWAGRFSWAPRDSERGDGSWDEWGRRVGGGAEGAEGKLRTAPPRSALTFLLTQTRRPYQIPPKVLTSEVQPERFTGWEWGVEGCPKQLDRRRR